MFEPLNSFRFRITVSLFNLERNLTIIGLRAPQRFTPYLCAISISYVSRFRSIILSFNLFTIFLVVISAVSSASSSSIPFILKLLRCPYCSKSLILSSAASFTVAIFSTNFWFVSFYSVSFLFRSLISLIGCHIVQK